MSGKYWDKAWSLVSGCTSCSSGCQNCWLRTMENRFKRCPYCGSTKKNCDEAKSKGAIACCPDCDHSGKVTPRYDRLEIPLHVKKPTVWSIWSDFAHEDLPKDFIHDVMDIVAQCPQHIFLALTKRPQNIHYKQFDNFPNWWSGLTVCTQAEADEKLPIFLQVPGKKFISFEPALEYVDFKLRKDKPCNHKGCFQHISHPCEECGYQAGKLPIDWIVAGSETGPRARTCDPEWLRSIRDQCQAAGVPFWLKQTDKKGNRLLDGREWNENRFKEGI